MCEIYLFADQNIMQNDHNIIYNIETSKQYNYCIQFIRPHAHLMVFAQAEN